MIVLYDNNGTPMIDDSGNLITIEGIEQTKQIIYNVFSTMLGEDLLNPDYGLNIKALKTIPNITPQLARSIVVQALNPTNIVGIRQVNTIDVEIDGETLYVVVNLVGEDGSQVTERISLGV